MCQYLVQIAAAPGSRSMYRCEHGTFHLAWDHGTLYLTREELFALAQVMEQVDAGCCACGYPSSTVRGRPGSTPDVHAEIWIDDAGLRLDPVSFRCLYALIAGALAWIEAHPPFTPESHLRLVERLANARSFSTRPDEICLN